MKNPEPCTGGDPGCHRGLCYKKRRYKEDEIQKLHDEINGLKLKYIPSYITIEISIILTNDEISSGTGCFQSPNIEQTA